jgi:histidinol phosphatase-like enzyme (inositol monophosphatase family)
MARQQNIRTSEKFNVSTALVSLAHRLADESAGVITKYFRSGFHIEDKKDQSPVTIADKQAERAIRKILEKERPGDGIHGEEFGSDKGRTGYLWVLDPIDGTKSFATGRPIFGTLIALIRDGEPILGMLNQPINGERWIGVKGQGTLFYHGKPTSKNGRRCRVRACPDIRRANVSTTGPDLFDFDEYTKIFKFLKKKTGFTLYGGDCYSYGTLASGWLDGVLEGHMKLHDYAALVPIVEEAGGIITDWKGKPLPFAPSMENREVLACGDKPLHGAMLRLLKRS